MLFQEWTAKFPLVGEICAALNSEDLGRAMIKARNGLTGSAKSADVLGQFVFQEAFALIHLADGDKDSARRAWKLMKEHFNHLQPAEQISGRSHLADIERKLEV